MEKLTMLFNEVIDTKETPNSWKEAVITLIPKEGQDTTSVKNFRPISLLNNDYKIFAKVMAERLKLYLRESIGKDQGGFLPNRQIRDNIRAVLNMIEYYERQPGKQVSFFFVDAEKAFDNLNWEFMFELMRRLDLGKRFTDAIIAVYTQQFSTLVINTDLTDKFRIEKGTRQGCPLSPLLFVMVLEVLLLEIQEAREIKGLSYKKIAYKYKAFVDDIMFVIEDPVDNLPKVLSKIQRFGELAGFYLNTTKSKILCKNMTEV